MKLGIGIVISSVAGPEEGSVPLPASWDRLRESGRQCAVTCIMGQAEGVRLGETNSAGDGIANHLSLRYGRLRARTSSRICERRQT